ncbi:MAG TPA: glycosyltransferase [Coriobacteriia bacterium]|nr:glycosyltransferase [Coriobacteriia bacterium]
MTRPSSSAGAPVRVLVCSPSLDGCGGMSTAANALLQTAAEHMPGYALEHVATHSATGERTRASAVASIPLTLGAAWRIATARPDIVHLFVGPRGSLARKSLLASIARTRGCAVVAQPHSGDVDVALTGERVDGVSPERLEKLCRTANVLALLRAVEIAPRFASAALCVVPNPVAVQDAPVTDERDIDVLYAGRLAHEKGVELLADVVARLVEARPGIRITIAGSAVGGTAESALAAMSAYPQVNAVGWVDESEVVALAKRARVVVSPSAVDSLPMSVLTAGACGAWVVATPVGEVPALLADGRGSLVEADADAWLAEILRVLDRLEPHAVPGEGLRQVVCERYAPPVVAGALQAAYDIAVRQLAATRGATGSVTGGES